MRSLLSERLVLLWKWDPLDKNIIKFCNEKRKFCYFAGKTLFNLVY